MSPRTQEPPHPFQSRNSNNGRHGPALPPIVPPGEMTRPPGDPMSAQSGTFPFSSRNSNSSNETPRRMQHILNPASSSYQTPRSTPDKDTRQGPLPPIPLPRNASHERPTPTQTPYGGPSGPTHRLSGPNLASPTGTIDAKKSPFLPSTMGGPPATAYPTPTSLPHGIKSGYPFPPQGPPPPGLPQRRESDGMSAVGSRTGSPTPSYSSYGQPSTAQGSPRSQVLAVASHGSQLLYHSQMQQPGGHVPPPHPNNPQMHPAHGHFQAPTHHHAAVQQPEHFRMMTLETEHGQIQVPVDMHAASKIADDKRKRNAGASARFRQRRKEKEREASTTISKLEDKVRELVDEKDYYRMERDYFRDLVYKHEGARAGLVPRMPSPVSERTRQGSLASSRDTGNEGGLSPGSGGTTEYREHGDRGSDDGRIVRRRTGGHEHEQRAAMMQQQHQQKTHSFDTPSPQHGSGAYPYPGAGPEAGSQTEQTCAQTLASVPQTMRTGPYNLQSHTSHVQYEMRWAAQP